MVTLLGQNVSAYGRERGEENALSALLRRLQEVEGLEWIKFITSHPRDTGEDVFEAMRDLPKVCGYLHMPAQSGSDAVLKRMKRGYSRGEYLDKVRRLKEICPAVSIAGDFIVGFPGETRVDFADTVSLVREVGYKNSFIFKYSPRPGTFAQRFDDDVPLDEKARRNNELLAVQKETSLAHNMGFAGRRLRVFAHSVSVKDPRELEGRTEGDEVVIFPAGREFVGSFVDVEIHDASPVALFGTMCG